MTETFERNFYKASAVCPKCGSGNPSPKYVPPNDFKAKMLWNQYSFNMTSYYMCRGKRNLLNVEPLPPTPEVIAAAIVPDRVDCLCQCGYQWSEKS